MSTGNTEWLTENSSRRFPFLMSGIPNDFVLDMKVVPDSSPPVRGARRVRVTDVVYYLLEDEWKLLVDFPDEGLSDSVTFPRLDSPGEEGAWRKGFGSLCSVSLAPGAEWYEPESFPARAYPIEWEMGTHYYVGDLALLGDVVYSCLQEHVSWDGVMEAPEDVPVSGVTWESYWEVVEGEVGSPGDLALHLAYPAELSPTRVEHGPDRFLGFRLEGEAEWEPSFEPEVLVAGWNVLMSPSLGGASIAVVPGAGEGRVPCDEPPCANNVMRVSGIAPSASGELSLEPEDCLRHEIVSLDDRVGVKIASDCLPCCDCTDYNAVSRAIARQSAKLGDVRDELWKSIRGMEITYNDAIDRLNQQVPGLVSVHSLSARPERFSFLVQNNTTSNLYGVVSIFLSPGSDGELEAAEGVMEGIQTESPPLVGLDEDALSTGIALPESSEGWEEGDILATVGTGSGFDPLPPGGRTRVSVVFPAVDAALQGVALLCSSIDEIFSDPRADDIHAWFDDDATIVAERARLFSLDGINSIVSPPDSWIGTDAEYVAACLAVPAPGGTDCSDAFSSASIVRSVAELRIFARRAQIAFGFTVPGEAEPVASLAELGEISDILAVPLGRDGVESMYSDHLEELVDELSERARTQMWNAIDGILSWQQVNPLRVVATAIYADSSFACRALDVSFETNPYVNGGDEVPPCMDSVIAIFQGE